MTNKRIPQEFKTIPIQVTEEQFNLFVFSHLSKGKRGPRSKLPFFKIFNYILKLIHTGVQWYCLPIEKDFNGVAEIHFVSVYRTFRRWVRDGSLLKIFGSSVMSLAKNNLLDTSILMEMEQPLQQKRVGMLLGTAGTSIWWARK